MDTGPGMARFFERGLNRAIDEGEIEILFQPQVALGSGRIVGAEALARWQPPEIGEIGAETLFGAAAAAGLSEKLSEYVQCRAVETAAEWPAALSGLRLSVNIIAADTVSPSFTARFLALLDGQGFDPHLVTVEITETEMIENLDAAARTLARLREKGVRVALDDFGTGYSSLLYLKALPLDAIKIDRRLTEDIGGSERDCIVIRSVIGMAKALGLEIIAEGVETEAQRDLLAAAGCDLYQGFLCSPPIDSAALTALLARSR